jgi:SsrA-binding protein
VVKEVGRKLIAQNKKARHDYSIEDVYECGIVLTGTEVKSLRAGRASLIDGYATVENGELWLAGVHIPEYTQGTWTNHDVRRKRKLLVHLQEIKKLHLKIKEGGVTLTMAKPRSRLLLLVERKLTISAIHLWSARQAAKLNARYLAVDLARINK